jgi:hypothetical protein
MIKIWENKNIKTKLNYEFKKKKKNINQIKYKNHAT